MSAEPKPTTPSNAWTTWENQIVDGRFTLRRYLGGSEHGAVFLTEHKAKNLAEAAIKFVRTDAPQAKTLLVHWQAAMALSHPHLVQVFEVGRWQSGGSEFLFVVMEYGDQTLAEILRRRPLSAEETLELLPPVLDALTFLHRRQLVHGRLKPSNLLAVGDQLKLASDTIRRAEDQNASTDGDVWKLGATLVEALTRRVLSSGDHSFDTASLPAGLPASLVETVRRCLAPAIADRPSVLELRAEYKLPAPATEPAKPAVQKAPSNTPTSTARQAAPAQLASSVARETVLPQQAPAASLPGAPPQSATTASRVNVPSQPAAASGTGAPQSVPSTSGALPQPVSSTSREVTPPPPAPSRAITPPLPGPTSSRETAQPQPVPSPSKANVSPQPTPSASQVNAPFQPAPSISRVNVPPQSATGASREFAPSQSTPAASQASARSQPAPSVSQANVASRSAPAASREIAPPQSVPSASRASAPPQAASTVDREEPPSAPKRHLFLSGIAAALLLLLAIWGGSRFTNKSQPDLQTTVTPEPTPAAPSAPPLVAAPKPTLSHPAAPVEQPEPPAATSSSVLNEVLPTVPDKIQKKIQGRVYVTVRVLVDPKGNVIGVLMDSAGPSKYFARLSEQAARQWQFTPADIDDSRVWSIRFEYTRDGVAVRTTQQ